MASTILITLFPMLGGNIQFKFYMDHCTAIYKKFLCLRQLICSTQTVKLFSHTNDLPPCVSSVYYYLSQTQGPLSYRIKYSVNFQHSHRYCQTNQNKRQAPYRQYIPSAYQVPKSLHTRVHHYVP